MPDTLLTDRVETGSHGAPAALISKLTTAAHSASTNGPPHPLQNYQRIGSNGAIETTPIVLDSLHLCAKQSDENLVLLDCSHDFPMRMPVRKTSAPPRPTCRAAENTGVSMNRCRTHEITPSSTRTTTIAIPKAS